MALIIIIALIKSLGGYPYIGTDETWTNCMGLHATSSLTYHTVPCDVDASHRHELGISVGQDVL